MSAYVGCIDIFDTTVELLLRMSLFGTALEILSSHPMSDAFIFRTVFSSVRSSILEIISVEYFFHFSTATNSKEDGEYSWYRFTSTR